MNQAYTLSKHCILKKYEMGNDQSSRAQTSSTRVNNYTYYENRYYEYESKCRTQTTKIAKLEEEISNLVREKANLQASNTSWQRNHQSQISALKQSHQTQIAGLKAELQRSKLNSINQVVEKSILQAQNNEMALKISTYYQQAEDLKTKIQNWCKFGRNCRKKSAKHIAECHPEKIDFSNEDWHLEKPEEVNVAESTNLNSISNTALKTVIEEEFDDNFSCFICYEVASGDNYQLTCCSKYMCADCYHENRRVNMYSHNCPHCRAPNASYQKISKLKSVLDDIRDNLVRNVISKMEENGADVEKSCDKNLRTIFARNFPVGTKVKNIEELPAFSKAIKVSLPWSREDNQIRGFAFIEFRNEQDCLDALLACKNLKFKGVKIQCRQSKPKNNN